jgi:DNA polymerase/3'-5' exonuclease PolX
MSTTETRIALSEAKVLAQEVLDLIGDWCEKTIIAGSIRRQAPTIGDIEILAIPHTHEEEEPSLGLWSARMIQVNDLDTRCIELIERGTFGKRLDVNGRTAVGSKYKRLSFKGVGLDLFVTTPEQWGVILAIRTGPSDFSHRFVTVRRQGGLLPDWLVVKDGQLRHRTTGEVIPTPGEGDFFDAIDYGWIEPEARR